MSCTLKVQLKSLSTYFIYIRIIVRVIVTFEGVKNNDFLLQSESFGQVRTLMRKKFGETRNCFTERKTVCKIAVKPLKEKKLFLFLNFFVVQV
jgi:hypothetical protein